MRHVIAVKFYCSHVAQQESAVGEAARRTGGGGGGGKRKIRPLRQKQKNRNEGGEDEEATECVTLLSLVHFVLLFVLHCCCCRYSAFLFRYIQRLYFNDLVFCCCCCCSCINNFILNFFHSFRAARTSASSCSRLEFMHGESNGGRKTTTIIKSYHVPNGNSSGIQYTVPRCDA